MNSRLPELAKTVTDAYFGAYEIGKLTDQGPLSIPEAYQVQELGVERLRARGDRRIGYKMGLTSQAKMRQMGVSQPIYGVLTERMRISAGGRLSAEGRIHPKIEPEIAFMIARPLRGKVGRDEALAACSGACAAMEIIDSRFRGFEFTLPDVIADNCSSSAFVLGELVRDPRELDLGNLGMILEIDGKAVQFGSSAAIYGHPAESLAELCAMLGESGRGLEPGDIVLAGAATAAVALERGTRIMTSVQDLGTVAIQYSGTSRI